MSVKNPFTGQQAVRVQPSVDDIFKLYVSNRLRRCPGLDDELNFSLDKLIVTMEKSVSLTSEHQLTCLEGLGKLEINQRTEQVYLNLESFQSMTVVLSNKTASMFQDGDITWQKIFQILDAVSQVIANIPEMVYLVDQFCHYSETVHVSSGGQTIAEWIFSVGQKIFEEKTAKFEEKKAQFEEKKAQFDENKAHFEENKAQFEEIKFDTAPEPDHSVIEKPAVTLDEYCTKCPCGSTLSWSANQFKECDACKENPCVIEGCRKKYPSEHEVKMHFIQGHTDSERKKFIEERKQYDNIHCAHCGSSTPARGVSAYSQCSSCKRFLCLRGICRRVYKQSEILQKHLAKCTYFFPDEKCGGCGGEKIKLPGNFTKCSNPSCSAHWCNWCNFEGKCSQSVSLHTRSKHNKWF